MMEKKLFNKLFAVVVAAVLAVALAVPVTQGFAADTYVIKLTGTNVTGNYQIYQVFKGTVSVSGSDTYISNVEFGSSIDSTKFSSSSAFYGKTAEGIAKLLQDNSGTAGYTRNFVKECTQTSGVLASTFKTASASDMSTGVDMGAAGYYIIRNSSVSGTDKSYTDFMVQLTKPNATVEVAPKGDVPSVTKKVKDVSYSSSTNADPANDDWQDSADYAGNSDMSAALSYTSSVPYKLTGDLPTNYANYEQYKYVFHDTVPYGITLSSNNQTAYSTSNPTGYKVVALKESTETDITSSFTIGYTAPASSSATGTLTFTCADLKKVTAVTLDSFYSIIVYYYGTMNTNAVAGTTGNPSQAYLEYSNDPQQASTTAASDIYTGNTAFDKVNVFTYGIKVNKVDESGNALKGAGFTLYKYDPTSTATDKYVAIGSEQKGTDQTAFSWSLVDEGKYKIVETTTPAGYGTAKDSVFTLTATKDASSDDPQLTGLTATNETGSTSISSWTADASKANVSADITNSSGFKPPVTGAQSIMILVGVLLVAGSAAGFVIVRKRSKKSAGKSISS